MLSLALVTEVNNYWELPNTLPGISNVTTTQTGGVFGESSSELDIDYLHDSAVSSGRRQWSLDNYNYHQINNQ